MYQLLAFCFCYMPLYESVCNFIWQTKVTIDGLHTGGRGHSNTSVVHMRDQRFSKHTLMAISPQKKHPLIKNFVLFSPKFTLKQAFLEDMFGEV